jgi:chromosome segregation ATPase
MSDFQRLEDMIGTLIQMVGNTNARVEELSSDMKEVRAELKDVRAELKEVRAELKEVKEDLGETKDILHTFRSETDVNFKKLDRRIKLIETDLDVTMVQVAEMNIAKP